MLCYGFLEISLDNLTTYAVFCMKGPITGLAGGRTVGALAARTLHGGFVAATVLAITSFGFEIHHTDPIELSWVFQTEGNGILSNDRLYLLFNGRTNWDTFDVVGGNYGCALWVLLGLCGHRGAKREFLSEKNVKMLKKIRRNYSQNGGGQHC